MWDERHAHPAENSVPRHAPGDERRARVAPRPGPAGAVGGGTDVRAPATGSSPGTGGVLPVNAPARSR